MDIRTDLAVERLSGSIEDEKGIHRTTRGKAFTITEIVIDDDSHLDTIGKGKGRYITLEGNSLSRYCDDYELMTEELAQELSRLIPDGEILVVEAVVVKGFRQSIHTFVVELIQIVPEQEGLLPMENIESSRVSAANRGLQLPERTVVPLFACHAPHPLIRMVPCRSVL